jgi:hypothetical protein
MNMDKDIWVLLVNSRPITLLLDFGSVFQKTEYAHIIARIMRRAMPMMKGVE